MRYADFLDGGKYAKLSPDQLRSLEPNDGNTNDIEVTNLCFSTSWNNYRNASETTLETIGSGKDGKFVQLMEGDYFSPEDLDLIWDLSFVKTDKDLQIETQIRRREEELVRRRKRNDKDDKLALEREKVNESTFGFYFR